mmetsp:Transcript_43104/g.130228  ORF Transcript_43104/g.130228 Transcript_43104/m.130228 type:complete len:272 (+) Transcript_43104:545-1360(+)
MATELPEEGSSERTAIASCNASATDSPSTNPRPIRSKTTNRSNPSTTSDSQCLPAKVFTVLFVSLSQWISRIWHAPSRRSHKRNNRLQGCARKYLWLESSGRMAISSKPGTQIAKPRLAYFSIRDSNVGERKPVSAMLARNRNARNARGKAKTRCWPGSYNTQQESISKFVRTSKGERYVVSTTCTAGGRPEPSGRFGGFGRYAVTQSLVRTSSNSPRRANCSDSGPSSRAKRNTFLFTAAITCWSFCSAPSWSVPTTKTSTSEAAVPHRA